MVILLRHRCGEAYTANDTGSRSYIFSAHDLTSSAKVVDRSGHYPPLTLVDSNLDALTISKDLPTNQVKSSPGLTANGGVSGDEVSPAGFCLR